MNVAHILNKLEIEPVNSGASWGPWILQPGGGELDSLNPADGSKIATVRMAGERDYEEIVERSRAAFRTWSRVPAPKRGEIVREIGDELRRYKAELGALVTLEMGKILAEGLGEVQEMIDIADFAVGLSRQLYGLTMHSERPGHRMYEQWHPLGVAGVISAFNFPVAVWAWNAMIAAVCGDCVIWKPSPKTPLTAIAVQKICNRVLERHGLEGVFSLLIGENAVVGERLLADRRIPLISFTGSCQVGRRAAEIVAARMGRSDSGAGRQQRHHRDGRRQPRPGAARRSVRRRGHGRPALHHDAPPVFAKRHRSAHDRSAARGVQAGQNRQPAG